MSISLKSAGVLLTLLNFAACKLFLPSDIAPDPFGPAGYEEIVNKTEAAGLIAIVTQKQPNPSDENFHYVAYNCGIRYDLVRYQLRPDTDAVILDGGAWYYINRVSGQVVYRFFEG